MASTNKTTNYELSQFVQTDKPAWLGDYNQDMIKIDAGMKANADDIDDVETAIATHETEINANTSDINTLQSSVNGHTTAIESINTTLGLHDARITSAQNKANTADTKADTNATNISNLSSTVSGLSSELDGFEASMNLTKFTDDNTLMQGASNVSLHLAQSADSAIFKVYGQYWFENNTGAQITYNRSAIPSLSNVYGIRSSLKLDFPPTQGYIISAVGILNNRFTVQGGGYGINTFETPIAVDNEGYIWFDISGSQTQSLNNGECNMRVYIPAIYFNKSFGDTPNA